MTCARARVFAMLRRTGSAVGIMVVTALVALGTATAGAPPAAAAGLTASAQYGMVQTDVFAVDNTGALTVSWLHGAGSWHPPAAISRRGFAPPGAAVAVTKRFGLDQTDVFVLDDTGALTVSWIGTAGGWHGPTAISRPGYAPPGAGLAASPQSGAAQTDVFVVDNAGELAVTSAAGGYGDWYYPAPISAPGFAPAGAAVAASEQFGMTQTDVFVVDNTGALTVSWNPGADSWRGPAPISRPGFARPGAGLAVSQQFGLIQTDVFVVDNTGALTVAWNMAAGSWQGPARIGGGGFAPSGAALTASQQFGVAQTDVFVVDNSGALTVAWNPGAGSWHGPGRISKSGFTRPGTGLTASQQFGIVQTDVFAVDAAGALTVAWNPGDGSWQGPGRISGPGTLPT